MSMPQFQRPTLAIQVGDLAPATHGMTYDNAFYSFEAQAGRPAVVIVLGNLPLADGFALLTRFQREAADLAAFEADVLALVDMQSPYVREYGAAALGGLRILYC